MGIRRPLSSRDRYRVFVEDYRRRRLDDATDARTGATAPAAAASADGVEVKKKGKGSANRRRYVRDYLNWLKPHRYAVGAVFVLALVAGALQMVEPLLM